MIGLRGGTRDVGNDSILVAMKMMLPWQNDDDGFIDGLMVMTPFMMRMMPGVDDDLDYRDNKEVDKFWMKDQQRLWIINELFMCPNWQQISFHMWLITLRGD